MISDELCWQNVGNFTKAKILTAHIQAVRISWGAPDRHILIISNEIFCNFEIIDYQLVVQRSNFIK